VDEYLHHRLQKGYDRFRESAKNLKTQVKNGFKEFETHCEMLRALERHALGSVEPETSFLESVKADFINDLIDVDSIEQMRARIEKMAGQRGTGEIERDLERARQKFFAFKQASKTRRLFSRIRGTLWSTEELRRILAFKVRTALLREYAEDLQGFLDGVGAYRAKEKSLRQHPWCLNGSRVIPLLSELVKACCLDSVKDRTVREDYCRKSGSVCYLTAETIADLSCRVDGILLNEMLFHTFRPGPRVLSSWLANCIPWSENVGWESLVVAREPEHLACVNSYLSRMDSYRILRKEDFTTEYRTQMVKAQILPLYSTLTVPEERAVTIYVHIGCFPLEAVLLKEYKDTLLEKMLQSRMLRELVIREGNHAFVSDLCRHLGLEWEEGTQEAEVLLMFKRGIMQMDIAALQEALGRFMSNIDMNRHTLAALINSLSRIEILMGGQHLSD